MTLKEITAELWEIVFPVLKLEAVGTIKAEIAEATNTSIMELWDKVKPIFIEEFEEVKADLEDTDVQGAARTKIKKTLQNNDALKNEIMALLEKVKTEKPTTDGLQVHNTGATIENQVNVSVNHGDFNFNKK